MSGLTREGVMPKETIFAAATAVGIEETEATGENYSIKTRVDVAWGREQTVQMATLTRDGFGIRTVDPESPDGLWTVLDRDAINRLIKTLRRARDQAYGVDE
jgi:hypothetical protein